MESEGTRNSFILQIQTIDQKPPHSLEIENSFEWNNWDGRHSTKIPYTIIANTNIYSRNYSENVPFPFPSTQKCVGKIRIKCEVTIGILHIAARISNNILYDDLNSYHVPNLFEITECWTSVKKWVNFNGHK